MRSRFLASSLVASLLVVSSNGCGSATDEGLFGQANAGSAGTPAEAGVDAAKETGPGGNGGAAGEGGEAGQGGEQPDAEIPGDAPVEPDSPEGPDAPIGPDAPLPSGDTCQAARPLAAGHVQATTSGLKDDYANSCGDIGAGTPDMAFAWHQDASDVMLSTYGPLTTWDTVISLRKGCGTGAEEELACSDDTRFAGSASRLFYHRLPQGDYQVVVDGAQDGAQGQFDLTAEAMNTPEQFQCGGPMIRISDLNGQSAGLDIHDFVPAVSRRVVRNGKACGNTAGEAMLGKGGEQIYELELTAQRKVRVSALFDDPQYAAVIYLRPDGGPQAGCESDYAQTDDLCVPYDQEFQLQAGRYWLIIDTPAVGDGTPPAGARYWVSVDIL